MTKFVRGVPLNYDRALIWETCSATGSIDKERPVSKYERVRAYLQSVLQERAGDICEKIDIRDVSRLGGDSTCKNLSRRKDKICSLKRESSLNIYQS